MKFSSLRYLLSEGFRNIWQNLFMAVASVGVLVSCLLLTGSAYLAFVNINRAFDWAYKQNVVVAFAKEDCTDEQIESIRDKLSALPNVSKVEYISKEESLEKYKGSVPEAVYEDMQGENNPYLDSFVLTFSDLGKFKDTVKQINQISGIDSTSYNQDIANTLTSIRKVVLMAGSWIILILFLVSLFIIANTIKLTVYNRRLEISIMKSVGATNTFVRVPFVIEGIVLGLLSGGVAFGLVYLLYGQLSGMFQSGLLGGLVSFSSVWHILLLGFLVIGITTGAIGSAISMRKYLRDEGGISSVL